MTREQIIKALSGSIDSMITRKSTMIHISGPMAEEILALLQDQEPNEPLEPKRGFVGGFPCFVCRNCGVAITEGDRYCRHCKQEVKWNG